jgi:hypothetical protein
LIFWSIIPGHAVRHSMPLSPGVAGLAAVVWIGWIARAGFRRSRFCEASLTTLVILWLGVKLVYVQYVIPPRTAERQPAAKGALLASLVPADQTLYLVGVKDEGVMFYFGGEVERLANFRSLPSTGEPVYCILTDAEWRGWPKTRPAELLRCLTDQQGAPLFLVRVSTDAILRADRRAGPQGQ